jgi:hypothetical protein
MAPLSFADVHGSPHATLQVRDSCPVLARGSPFFIAFSFCFLWCLARFLALARWLWSTSGLTFDDVWPLKRQPHRGRCAWQSCSAACPHHCRASGLSFADCTYLECTNRGWKRIPGTRDPLASSSSSCECLTPCAQAGRCLPDDHKETGQQASQSASQKLLPRISVSQTASVCLTATQSVILLLLGCCCCKQLLRLNNYFFLFVAEVPNVRGGAAGLFCRCVIAGCSACFTARVRREGRAGRASIHEARGPPVDLHAPCAMAKGQLPLV